MTDSAPGIIHAISYALDYMGVHMERSEMTRFIGPPLKESLPEYCGFDPEQTERTIIKFREYYHDRGWKENAPYPGIPELLRDLQEAGKRLLVATSKPENMAKQVLEYFLLAGYFERICGAPQSDPDSAKKVDVIRKALRHAGGPTSAVMVGDRRHDAAGAHEAGLPCVGVLYGYGGRTELKTAGAEFIAEDVAALRSLLLMNP